MVSKVTVKTTKYTNILMGTVQAAIANGVLDSVRAGDIPKSKANDLGVIVSVWLDPAVLTEKVDFEVLFRTHREATAKAIHKAMHNEPSIDWLLENQDKVVHCFHQMAMEGDEGKPRTTRARRSIDWKRICHRGHGEHGEKGVSAPPSISSVYSVTSVARFFPKQDRVHFILDIRDETMAPP